MIRCGTAFRSPIGGLGTQRWRMRFASVVAWNRDSTMAA
jgi:hypothetical protein